MDVVTVFRVYLRQQLAGYDATRTDLHRKEQNIGRHVNAGRKKKTMKRLNN